MYFIYIIYYAFSEDHLRFGRYFLQNDNQVMKECNRSFKAVCLIHFKTCSPKDFGRIEELSINKEERSSDSNHVSM